MPLFGFKKRDHLPENLLFSFNEKDSPQAKKTIKISGTPPTRYRKNSRLTSSVSSESPPLTPAELSSFQSIEETDSNKRAFEDVTSDPPGRAVDPGEDFPQSLRRSGESFNLSNPKLSSSASETANEALTSTPVINVADGISCPELTPDGQRTPADKYNISSDKSDPLKPQDLSVLNRDGSTVIYYDSQESRSPLKVKETGEESEGEQTFEEYFTPAKSSTVDIGNSLKMENDSDLTEIVAKLEDSLTSSIKNRSDLIIGNSDIDDVAKKDMFTKLVDSLGEVRDSVELFENIMSETKDQNRNLDGGSGCEVESSAEYNVGLISVGSLEGKTNLHKRSPDDHVNGDDDDDDDDETAALNRFNNDLSDINRGLKTVRSNSIEKMDDFVQSGKNRPIVSAAEKKPFEITPMGYNERGIDVDIPATFVPPVTLRRPLPEVPFGKVASLQRKRRLSTFFGRLFGRRNKQKHVTSKSESCFLTHSSLSYSPAGSSSTSRPVRHSMTEFPNVAQSRKALSLPRPATMIDSITITNARNHRICKDLDKEWQRDGKLVITGNVYEFLFNLSDDGSGTEARESEKDMKSDEVFESSPAENVQEGSRSSVITEPDRTYVKMRANMSTAKSNACHREIPIVGSLLKRHSLGILNQDKVIKPKSSSHNEEAKYTPHNDERKPAPLNHETKSEGRALASYDTPVIAGDLSSQKLASFDCSNEAFPEYENGSGYPAIRDFFQFSPRRTRQSTSTHDVGWFDEDSQEPIPVLFQVFPSLVSSDQTGIPSGSERVRISRGRSLSLTFLSFATCGRLSLTC